MHRLLLAAVFVGGCGLIDSNGIHVEYSFDPQNFVFDLGHQQGTLPSVPCQSDVDCDAIPPPAITGATVTPFCDMSKTCALRFDLRKLQTIDLRNAMTPVPSEAVQFGIDVVTLERVDYWVEAGANTLSVDTPPVDLYVASMAARDENDPSAALFGSVAPLPAMSNQCGDPPEARPTAQQQGKTVCSMPLSSAGADALGGFVKQFKTTPFQIIAHTIVTVSAGEAVPEGALSFSVQPTVALSILK